MSARRLVACSGCSRHFRVTEDACPFCRAPSAQSIAAASPARDRDDGRPLTRAAILFATSAVVAACGKSTSQPDAGPVITLPAPPYGVAPYDAAFDEPPPPPPPPPPPEDASVRIRTNPVAVPPYGVAVPPEDPRRKKR